MASPTATSLPFFSYSSCSQLQSSSSAGLHIGLHPTSLHEVLRRCSRLQKRRERVAAFCAVSFEDGVEDSNRLKSTQRRLIQMIYCSQAGNSLAANKVTALTTMGDLGATHLSLLKLSEGAMSSSSRDSSCTDVAGIVGISSAKWLFWESTSGLAGAIAYLSYILSTRLEGLSRTDGIQSVLSSFSLLLQVLRVGRSSLASLQAWIANRFDSKEVKQVGGLHLATTALVVLALSSTCTGTALALNASTGIDLPPVEPKVTTSSSSLNLSLAKHLQSVGAKMYGAFWCSHCFEQKQMFGREALKLLNYVECYPEGYRQGIKIAKACDAANIKGFPTWIIKGEMLSGEQELSEIARVAGFDGFQPSK